MNTEFFFHKSRDEAHRGVKSEGRNVNAEVVGVGAAPRAGGVEIVVVGALFVAVFDDVARCLLVHPTALHDAAQAVVEVGGHKDVDMAWMMAQDVVGHAPHKDTRSVGCHFLDDAALEGEEIFVAQLVVVEVAPTTDEGLHHTDDRAEETFLLVRPLKDVGTQAAFFGRFGENFFVVAGNAEALGKAFGNLGTAAAQLATDVDDKRRVVHTKSEG